MENQVAGSASGRKDSFIVCTNSQGAPVRGSLIHFSYQNSIFEVYNPFSILQLSEVLTHFKIIIGDRTLYAGRAVVRNLVNTGIMLVCEVTLVDSWSDIDVLSITENTTLLLKETKRFVSEWSINYNILPEFKVLTSDLHGFLSDLSLWLKPMEMTLSKTSFPDKSDAQAELVEKVMEPIRPTVREFLQRLEVIGPTVPSELSGAHKAYLRRDIHPFTLCSPFVHRTYSKPLGYAGDYAMINMILGDRHIGNSLFSKTINALVVEAELAEAHRNRIKLLTKILDEEGARAAREGRQFRVLNVACGPAREVVDFIEQSEHANRCEITLLDFSKEALQFAQQATTEARRTCHSDIRLSFVEKSIDTLLRETLEQGAKQQRGGEKYHLVYCAGLFDYLGDSVCRRLMLMYYQWLLPGGTVAATNVHAANPQRYFMEYLLEWNIIHRNEEQMLKLFDATPNRDVFTDETGLNLFIKAWLPKNNS